MAGGPVSTPFSISANKLERFGVAKFAVMFGEELRKPVGHLPSVQLSVLAASPVVRPNSLRPIFIASNSRIG